MERAKQREFTFTPFERFQHTRMWVKKMFQSFPFQAAVAVLLVGNFAANAFQAQIKGDLIDDEGNPTQVAKTLETMDLCFTGVFTVELIFNMYAHLWWEFVSDGWCMFDFVVVSVSLLSALSDNVPDLPITVFRLMRTFRVLRLFGRLESIRAIINALSASILPVLNAFFIMFIVLALYAILGVTLFSEIAPLSFGNLSVAFIELFRITAGETWVDEVPQVDEEGNVQWALGIYIMSFILICNWTLLQVSVAVLLDNFVCETAREKEEKHQLFMEHKRAKDSLGNVLDPLLRMLATEYIDENDLSAQLSALYAILCTAAGKLAAPTPMADKESGGGGGQTKRLEPKETLSVGDASVIMLTKKDFCAAMGRLNLEVPMHLSDLDYDTITSAPALDMSAFICTMRSQVHGYILRKLQRSVSETETQEHFATLAAMKMMASEMDRLRQDLLMRLEGGGKQARAPQGVMTDAASNKGHLRGGNADMSGFVTNGEYAEGGGEGRKGVGVGGAGASAGILMGAENGTVVEGDGDKGVVVKDEGGLGFGFGQVVLFSHPLFLLTLSGLTLTFCCALFLPSLLTLPSALSSSQGLRGLWMTHTGNGASLRTGVPFSLTSSRPSEIETLAREVKDMKRLLFLS